MSDEHAAPAKRMRPNSVIIVSCADHVQFEASLDTLLSASLFLSNLHEDVGEACQMSNAIKVDVSQFSAASVQLLCSILERGPCPGRTKSVQEHMRVQRILRTHLTTRSDEVTASAASTEAVPESVYLEMLRVSDFLQIKPECMEVSTLS
jgi:hypothetical protein